MLVDPKGDDYARYKGATRADAESRRAAPGASARWKNEKDLAARANALREKLELDALLLTRGEEGMNLFRKNRVFRVSAEKHEVSDVTGAGDTVIATLAVMLAAGAGHRGGGARRQPRRRHQGDQARHRRSHAAGDFRKMRMSYYVVTGAAGFIGSRLVAALNRRGVTRNHRRRQPRAQRASSRNLAGCDIADYVDQAQLHRQRWSSSRAPSKPSSTRARAPTPWRATAAS